MQDGEIELAVTQAALRRGREQREGLGVIGRSGLAADDDDGGIVHGLDVALPGGRSYQERAEGSILRHALAALEQGGEPVLRGRQPARRGLLIPEGGLGGDPGATPSPSR